MYQTRRNAPPGAGVDCRTTTVAQAAAVLGVSLRTLQRMIKTSRTPKPIVVGSHGVRFNSEEFDAWLEAGAPKRELWEQAWAGREALRFRCSCGKKWSPRALWRCVTRFLATGGADGDEDGATESNQ